ncbi:MAG: membrane integrity-associated transporter subunit PqiC [Nitrospira sp.]|jgi:cholesterol transport system auxiliary component|nr:ABC-type transport auxiliary lipoprotein family protein [Nitrospira sp. BO4]
MMKDRLIQVACALLIVTAAGCLSLGKDSQEIRTYQLSLDGWHSAGRPDGSNGPVLLVSPPQPEPGFETQRMVYVKRPYELDFYAVNQWADTPVRMLTPLMVEVLSRSGVWHSVIPLPNSIRGDYRLDTYGFSLQQEFFQQPSRVRVSIRTQLVDLKESEIVSTRAFEAVENAPSENAYGGVLAANRAVAALLDQVGSWLGQCVQHSSECGR